MSVDKGDMLGRVRSFGAQCREALTLPEGLRVSGSFSHIVVCGMGGSGIVGDVLKAYLAPSTIPVTVVRDYAIPGFVDSSSLVFCISYSGNTEETLAALEEVQSRGATVVGITSGGTLGENVTRKVVVPGNIQPRAALGYLFFSLIGVLKNSEIITIPHDEISEALSVLEDSDSFEAEGKEIASKIQGRVPLVYTSHDFEVCSYRWKCQLNENGKSLAFSNVCAEMNHNEIVGYHGVDRSQFVVVMLRDSQESERMKKRLDVTKKILETKVDVISVESRGNSLLARLFSLMYVGDFASYFVAIEKGVDPTPVAVIENLKKELRS